MSKEFKSMEGNLSKTINSFVLAMEKDKSLKEDLCSFLKQQATITDSERARMVVQKRRFDLLCGKNMLPQVASACAESKKVIKEIIEELVSTKALTLEAFKKAKC